MAARRSLYLILGVVAFVLATNRWLGFSQSIDFVKSFDVTAYLVIARAAPGLPQPEILSHFGFRFLSHYLVGVTAQLSGLSLEATYRAYSWLCLAGVIWAFSRALRAFRISESAYRLLLAAALLNPYLIRYYLVAPGMLSDQLFLLGLALSLWALARQSVAGLAGGILVAVLGRQTGILILPGALFWLVLGEGWGGRSRVRRLCEAALVAAVVSAVYTAMFFFALRFSLPENLSSALIGLYPAHHTTGVLALHFLRVFVSFAFVAAVACAACLVARPAITVEVAGAVLIGLAIISQPAAFSPFVVVQNEGRLSAMGLLAFLVGLGLLLRDSPRLTQRLASPRVLALLIAGLAAGSFHHLFTVIGPPGAAAFAGLQLLVALGAAMAFVVA